MLAVHWSPVKNTKRILRQGIRKGKDGLFCFPLTGHHQVDRWWAQYFRSVRPRTTYNGFVFRIQQEDLPATFGDWVFDVLGEPRRMESLQALEAEVRSTIIWRFAADRITDLQGPMLSNAEIEEAGLEFVRQDPNLISRIQSDPNWMQWTFENHQIVLSRSIHPRRILRTISGSQASGRQRKLNQRNSSSRIPIDH